MKEKSMMGRIATRAVQLKGGQTTASPLTPVAVVASQPSQEQPEAASPNVVLVQGEAMICPA
jgi:hypothetical protein